jgi:large subunit ribosomal protein L28
MPRACVKTGKKTGYGNTRSHSMRHTRRTWKANIQKKRVLDTRTGKFVVMKVSAAYLRTLSKRLMAGKMA